MNSCLKEQPSKDIAGNSVDLTLEKGMILSVDCPLLEDSQAGTAHLENLTLITESGSQVIHDDSNKINMV